jgi:protein phosphatase
MKIDLPKFSLVVLVGPSGSGKSSFARKHFLPTEVLSSDYCRGLVSDDENSQEATNDAFDVLHYIAAKRLAAGLLTVVDATNVQKEARLPLIELARKFHALPVAIVLDLPEALCRERNESRPDRDFGPHVVRNQSRQLRRSMRWLKKDGFRHIHVLKSPEDVDAAVVERSPLWNDRRDEHGPFDIIGDVHGCYDELTQLLGELGYEVAGQNTEEPLWAGDIYAHPGGRKAVFLGDMSDRGPRVLDTLRLVRNMIQMGSALAVPGNHDVKLMRALRGHNVQVKHGLGETLAEIEALTEETRDAFKKELDQFIYTLVSHYVLDDGQLCVAHAGMRQDMQGRGSRAVREFALYGETTGETDEFGLPVRYNWAAEYRGNTTVVYGHTPIPEPEWLNRTVNIDTGCVFGGSLTALRYPEREFVAVPAKHTYCEPAKPFIPEDEQAPALTGQQQQDDLLDAEDVIGKRLVDTRLRPKITIREENATAALEAMSRFATNPKWLIHLPPTMSPCEASKEADYLEFPTQAFAHFRSLGVPRVVCQQKHMGSRAIVIVCREPETVRTRFGITSEDGIGTIFSRKGRRFFDDHALEQGLLRVVHSALTETHFWESMETDWVCLDCELMPWSAKAQQLLQTQYAALGSAATASVVQAVSALETAVARDDIVRDFPHKEGSSSRPADPHALLERMRQRQGYIDRYIKAYREYCWTVDSLDDLRLAPFHILATEGRVHVDRDHVWHMDTIAEFCHAGPDILLATPYRVVDVTDPESEAAGTQWWLELTAKGGEGMVVKPMDFITRGRKGLVQPAIKVRGQEYLRIIYGPEYTTENNLARLRKRRLGAKRSLAEREFALGIEALERFVRKEPLRRVHECVFGVLAMESEPVDPRL